MLKVYIVFVCFGPNEIMVLLLTFMEILIFSMLFSDLELVLCDETSDKSERNTAVIISGHWPPSTVH